jgi:hypothetical protein
MTRLWRDGNLGIVLVELTAYFVHRGSHESRDGDDALEARFVPAAGERR